eukprot:NODE_6209_length_521_cov_322.448498.p2 GENE.NODE_6209_length_521_cov_322.448498~~NODE_6209_length_521_cov_322.448498.p2  ORF type:complete len:133 (-),score=40.98 NODE_6209_length_521_cov_322.448498:105-503(-)
MGRAAMAHFSISALLSLGLFVAAEASSYFIGKEKHSGAYLLDLDEESRALDLELGCYEGKMCPPVIILQGRFSGTLELNNCIDGTLYNFVNNGDLDAGIVVQQEGGMHGSRGIEQYGVGPCFCYTGRQLFCR